MGDLTSGTRAVALTRLRHTGLPLPAVLITADDVKRGKPNPEGYLLAASRLNVAPGRCVVVEDAPPGISAAQAAGMRVVALTTTHSHGELRGADVTAAQLADIQVSPSDMRPAGRLTVRITEAWFPRATSKDEMVGKKLGAAAVILDTQGRVLLVKHSYGPLNWELPGGGAEQGESIVETALREVREETGLHVVAQHTTGIYYDTETDMLRFVFLCQSRDTTLVPRFEAEEISASAFWSPTALPRPISDFTVRRIADAMAGVMQPLPAPVGPRQWLD